MDCNATVGHSQKLRSIPFLLDLLSSFAYACQHSKQFLGRLRAAFGRKVSTCFPSEGRSGGSERLLISKARLVVRNRGSANNVEKHLTK
jgi:hypothetical protein